MSNVTTADLEDEMTMFNVAYLSAMNDFIDKKNCQHTNTENMTDTMR